MVALRILPCILLACLCCCPSAGPATWDPLLPLFTDLPGFGGEAAQGMELSQDDMDMITVNRSYQNNQQALDATLMIGTHAMAQVQPAMEMETAEYRITVEQADGFEVRRYFDKQDQGGALFVVLSPGAAKGAVLIIGYHGMNDTEAMAAARNFDWKEMRRQVEKLLK